MWRLRCNVVVVVSHHIVECRTTGRWSQCLVNVTVDVMLMSKSTSVGLSSDVHLTFVGLSLDIGPTFIGLSFDLGPMVVLFHSMFVAILSDGNFVPSDNSSIPSNGSFVLSDGSFVSFNVRRYSVCLVPSIDVHSKTSIQKFVNALYSFNCTLC